MHTVNNIKEDIYKMKCREILYNETFEQYDDREEWLSMVLNELDTTLEALKEMGIIISADGGVTSTDSDNIPRKDNIILLEGLRFEITDDLLKRLSDRFEKEKRTLTNLEETICWWYLYRVLLEEGYETAQDCAEKCRCDMDSIYIQSGLPVDTSVDLSEKTEMIEPVIESVTESLMERFLLRCRLKKYQLSEKEKIFHRERIRVHLLQKGFISARRYADYIL